MKRILNLCHKFCRTRDFGVTRKSRTKGFDVQMIPCHLICFSCCLNCSTSSSNQKLHDSTKLSRKEL